MKLETSLEMRQFMRLALTPQMRQSLSFLQSSTYDLGDYLLQKSQENPFIEVDWSWDASPSSRQHGTSLSQGYVSGPVQWIASGKAGPEEHLAEQLRWTECPDDLRKIVSYLIGNVDESGYLRMNTEEAAEFLKTEPQAVEQAVQLLHTFEPPGIGARSLRECLLIQIRRDPDAVPYAEDIIDMFIEDLAKGKTEKIRQALNIQQEEIEDAVDYIRGLHPRPGSQLSSDEAPYIVPDAEVAVKNGEIEVQLLDASMPKIVLRQEYIDVLRQRAQDTDPLLMKQMKEAATLADCLDKRNQTLKRVIVTIAEAQTDFFQTGWAGLHALTSKQLAKQLQLHESTVSRAVQHKYVKTDYGVVPLKSLLCKALPTEEGRHVSVPSVKSKIAEWIRREDKQKPLSDAQIAARLMKDGIVLSRRGVAKYRHELKIRNASMRKKGMKR